MPAASLEQAWAGGEGKALTFSEIYWFYYWSELLLTESGQKATRICPKFYLSFRGKEELARNKCKGAIEEK